MKLYIYINYSQKNNYNFFKNLNKSKFYFEKSTKLIKVCIPLVSIILTPMVNKKHYCSYYFSYYKKIYLPLISNYIRLIKTAKNNTKIKGVDIDKNIIYAANALMIQPNRFTSLSFSTDPR